MALTAAMADSQDPQLRDRNRRTLRVLLAIIAALLVAGLLVGIRW
jgi:hypothetical protein